MMLLIKNVIFSGKKIDVFISKNKIQKIGRNLNLKAKEKIDGKGEKAILPGFFNLHTHSPMILFRGLGEDMALKEWLEKKVWPMEEKLTEDDVFWATKLACLEMIRSGTTTFNEMYFFPKAQIEAIKEMGMRAIIGLVVVDFSNLGCTKENAEKIFFELKDKLPSTIQFSIAPHAIYTVSKENLVWVKKFAKKQSLLIHTHLSETEWEVKFSLQKYKLRPVEFLEKIKFLNKNCLFAHSIWLNKKEIEILAKRKCNLIYNPSSNLKLASGLFPYQKIKEKNINICLGTDGPASNNSLDLIREIKIGSLIQKGIERDPKIFSKKEAFEILIENGAKALKIKAGKIKEGYLADLILIDLNKIYFQPGHEFLADLIYSASGECVSDVICNGKILMRDGRIEGEEKIKKKAKERLKNFFKKTQKS